MDFEQNLTGTLVGLEEDENSRFRYEIWFDYTRRSMNLIREGAMLAVPNFASSGPEQHLSILELVTVLPMHYALGDARDLKGFPGFVVEAAKSIVNDWEEQESEATEDTTKIKCVAIPTNLEVVQTASGIGNQPKLEPEANLPMLGSTVRVLDTVFTSFVANNGIGEQENTFDVGYLIRDKNVQIKVRVEDLLKTHFGIFGFTGAGKSNLMSTLISDVLEESNDTVKIIFFDLMGEYTTLLIDQLLQPNCDAALVCLGKNTLPGPVFRYVNGESNASLDLATESLSRYTLLPKHLKSETVGMKKALGRLLQANRIKVFDEAENMSMYFVFFDSNNPKSPAKYKTRRDPKRSNRYTAIKAFVDLNGGTSKQVDAELCQKLIDGLETECADGGSLFEWEEDLRGVKSLLETALPSLKEQLRCSITMKELLASLNDKTKNGLFVINAHNPDQLRNFARDLGNAAYESRRQSGEIEPIASFVFDEADEFIPQGATGSYEASSEIAMTLARRGRKFGLGIGIATQRVRYLNTSIMAQPHTYFVSKMPRVTDRQAVVEAFGVSDDMFRQTFKFKKGDWLLMSYDATGLEAIPLPVHCADANERIRAFLNKP